MKIGILSDTHSYMDERILHHLSDCDEVWHAGDFGAIAVVDSLLSLKKTLRGVYGNIDGKEIREMFPKEITFKASGLTVMMAHIAGYPGTYLPKYRNLIKTIQPDIFVTGHSHILKVMRVPTLKTLHINPGAAGREGWQKVRTLIKMEINDGKPENLVVVELGTRGG